MYLKILSSFHIHRMLAQFRLLYRDRPSFLDYVDLGEAEGGHDPHNNEHDRKGKEASGNKPQRHMFGRLLQRR